jgi:hypothetical protein
MLPDAWVDRIFARLAVRYGVAFTRQWDGIDPALVKADWAEQLSGLVADDLDHGLHHLPVDRPPTVGQFRECCRRTPSSPPIALPSPPADPAVINRLLAKLRPALQHQGDRGWAHRLKRRDEAGERLSLFQRQCYREALYGSGTAPNETGPHP